MRWPEILWGDHNPAELQFRFGGVNDNIHGPRDCLIGYTAKVYAIGLVGLGFFGIVRLGNRREFYRPLPKKDDDNG